MDRSRYAALYLSESREHISTINHLLLSLEAAPTDRAPVEGIFRAVHTLKGMSAAMGHRRAADLAHALEHLLEQLRAGSLAVDGEVIEALFAAVDAMERAIDGESGAGEPAAVLERLETLAEDADSPGPHPGVARPPLYGSGEGTGKDGPPLSRGREIESGNERPAGGGAAGRLVRATVMIQPTAALPAVRAVLVLRRARELGEVEAVEPAEDRLAAGELPGPLSFRLRTERDAEELRAGLLGAGEVAHLLLEEDPEEEVVGQGGGRAAEALVRISQARLDSLVDQVGELVIARDRMRRLVDARGDEELGEAADQLSALVAGLRDEVMRVRMVPVGEVFDRFPRLVRDAARGLGRRVEFSMHGRDTELDRSLVNELGELLVHLLRNAVDHGIEPPEERVGAGKPEAGALRLVASRDRSQVVVRVEDDGRGIDRERIVAKAAGKGWIPEGRELSDQEVFHLITRPGFSTAREVTDVSGRGVGLDVVRTRAHALGGSLEVASAPGEGTTFTLRLPLSLAIIRALQVEVAGEAYSIPLPAIVEVTEMTDAAVLWQDGGELLPLREEALPLVWLGEVLAPGTPRGNGHRPVVVVDGGDGKLGLAVDVLGGQHEAVLKPFDSAAGMLPLFAGATLLSDGRPSLILDVPRLSAWAGERAGRGGASAGGSHP